MEFNYRIPFFYLLKTEFWDTPIQLIQKSINTIEKSKEDTKVQLSNHILQNETTRAKYLNFLCYNYAFSQPYDLTMLQENFNSFIFPYYIFSIRLLNEKGKAFILALNYINRLIVIKYKASIVFYFNFNKSKSSEVVLQSQPEDNKFKIKRNNISIGFSAEIPRQSELIDMLLNYFQHKTSNYKQLKDDLYIPSGIILKTEVMKQHKMLVKSKRFMVLGSGQLMLFK